MFYVMNSISYQLTALVTRSFDRFFPAPEHFRYVRSAYLFQQRNANKSFLLQYPYQAIYLIHLLHAVSINANLFSLNNENNCSARKMSSSKASSVVILHQRSVSRRSLLTQTRSNFVSLESLDFIFNLMTVAPWQLCFQLQLVFWESVFNLSSSPARIFVGDVVTHIRRKTKNNTSSVRF